MRPAILAIGAGMLLAPAPARADEAPSRVEVGAGIAYAAPVGSAERGSLVSDTAIAAVPLRVDVGYAVTRRVAFVAALAYAPVIPTLCQSAGDCISSLGTDVALSLRTRVLLARFGRMSTRLELGVGYEWLTSRLVDNGVASSRAYRGPVLLDVAFSAPLRIGARWTTGPVLSSMLGVFSDESLATPAFRQDARVPDSRPHGWLALGWRLGRDF